MANGIFISYRRKDTETSASRLADDLRDGLEGVQIFRDVENISPGEDFTVALERALRSCKVMLVLIGPLWLDIRDEQGRRRLDDAQDWTRLEVATALQRNVRVVPVLVEHAALPGGEQLPEDLRGLTRRQAVEIDNNRWRYDVNHLLDALVQHEGLRRRQARAGSGAWKMLAGTALVLALAVVGWSVLRGSGPDAGPSRSQGDPLPGTQAGSEVQAAVAPAPREKPLVQPVATEPEPINAPLEEAAPPAANAVPDISGMWRALSGEIYLFNQRGNDIALVVEANGQRIGNGRASLQGNLLRLAVTMNLNGMMMNANCNLQATPDWQGFAGQCMGPNGPFLAQIFR